MWQCRLCPTCMRGMQMNVRLWLTTGKQGAQQLLQSSSGSALKVLIQPLSFVI